MYNYKCDIVCGLCDIFLRLCAANDIINMPILYAFRKYNIEISYIKISKEDIGNDKNKLFKRPSAKM